ncbi:MAG: glycosyltransferase family 2 protein [Candidatus Competibacteraceae bacterium]|nr:glycosyltransferase family 2 protein [Candidatus Competibacteraceae bacterium]
MPVYLPQKPQIAAVIVSFNPDLSIMSQQLAALAPQIQRLIVVDNGSQPALRERLATMVNDVGGEYHMQADNPGLAAAQSLGIQRALAEDASHVLLLDQDSLPASGMVNKLLAVLDELTAQGEAVAAVGPRLISARDGRSTPFARFHFWGVEKIACADACVSIRTDFLIASGLLTPASVYRSVGLPEEGLFIDNVDLEWSFRAQSHGYRLYGVCDAILTHRLGEQSAYLPGLGSLGPIHIHGPTRQYYQTRNRLSLYGRSYCPWAWKWQDFPRAVFKLIYFSTMVPPRWRNARMMARGVLDALQGKTGRCPLQ